MAYAGSTRLLVLAGLASAQRRGVMAVDPPLRATGLLQTVHAMRFGAAHQAASH
jgi:hypothetical protein